MPITDSPEALGIVNAEAMESDYLLRFMVKPRPFLPAIIWSRLVTTSADFRFEEHLQFICQIYREHLIDPDFKSFDLLEARIQKSEYDSQEMKAYQLINSAEEELTCWPDSQWKGRQQPCS